MGSKSGVVKLKEHRSAVIQDLDRKNARPGGGEGKQDVRVSAWAIQ